MGKVFVVVGDDTVLLVVVEVFVAFVASDASVGASAAATFASSGHCYYSQI